MKRKWENHELVEHWTIDEEDQQLIRQKRGINRLSFALLSNTGLSDADTRLSNTLKNR
ncbi:MAG: DUF4158 domain-containing protein [Leptolyngbya sp. SIO4C1]|nr:DUF4158 domain-containing protein [Leptolyngbya sp. SIO4C1]